MSAARQEAAVKEARRWIGTPFRHQGALIGVGADCLGLVRGVQAALTDGFIPPVPPYSGDWAEAARAKRPCSKGWPAS